MTVFANFYNPVINFKTDFCFLSFQESDNMDAGFGNLALADSVATGTD